MAIIMFNTSQPETTLCSGRSRDNEIENSTGALGGQALPVILGDGSQQLPAGARIEAADAARGLLDLGHLVLILKVDGLR